MEKTKIIAIPLYLKNQYQQNIDQAILRTQEEERYEIGCELHDNVCQLLAAGKLTLGMLKKTVPPGKLKYFVQANEYIKMSLDEIRNLSHRLAPVFFNNASLETTFKNLCNSFNIQQQLRIIIDFDKTLLTRQLSIDIQLNLYRILQEQLKNIFKYAKATIIKISIAINSGHLAMSIADNGKGFDIRKIKEGIGLANMKRRAELLFGVFLLTTSPGHGCTVTITIPVEF